MLKTLVVCDICQRTDPKENVTGCFYNISFNRHTNDQTHRSPKNLDVCYSCIDSGKFLKHLLKAYEIMTKKTNHHIFESEELIVPVSGTFHYRWQPETFCKLHDIRILGWPKNVYIEYAMNANMILAKFNTQLILIEPTHCITTILRNHNKEAVKVKLIIEYENLAF